MTNFFHFFKFQTIFTKWFKNDNESICKLLVDGTDFCILEPTPFDRKYFSHKFNGTALRYEIAISFQGGKICWINGPFPAGEFSDINIFRRSLKLMLLSQEIVEADKGYRGKYNKVDLPHKWLPKKSASLQKYAKTRIWANGCFKQFNCFKTQDDLLFRSRPGSVRTEQYKRRLFKVNYKTFNVK